MIPPANPSRSALVKVDVAAADLGRSIPDIFDLVDGGMAAEAGIMWAFDLARHPGRQRRNLRCWRPELLARAGGDSGKYHRQPVSWVVAQILPETRQTFQAGEVDRLFQIRPRTRIDLHPELKGVMGGGRHTYARPHLESFLLRRWVGTLATCSDRRAAK